jgi:predicted nucleotide-binding protein (sugar kinase/HSP70/actin superfamily)
MIIKYKFHLKQKEYFQGYPVIIKVMKTIQKPHQIGIPNTLFAAYHLAYWRKLITLSGMEAVISGESTKEMADQGGRLLPHEFCIPIKVVMGHILRLLEMGVDKILLPRMLGHQKNHFFCPKFIGLPEIVKYTLNLEDRLLLSPEVICNGLSPRVTKFPAIDSISFHRIMMAEKEARQGLELIIAVCRQYQLMLPEAALPEASLREARVGGNVNVGAREHKNRVTVGLLGYAYSLYDPFISKGLPKKLQKLGVGIRTWEMVEPPFIGSALAGLKRPLFWNFGRLILGAGLHFLQDISIDGLIYVTTFGCGPDAVTDEILKIEAGKRQKPFLLLNLDEHTEEGHLYTRLEAFVDMLTALKEDQVV